MSTCVKSAVALFVLCVHTFVASGDVTNFVVSTDDNSQIYVADWNSASNHFVNFRWIYSLRQNEGEGANTRGIVAGDFNGDGFCDIAAARRLYSQQGAVHLLINDGANNFTPRTGNIFSVWYC